MNIGDKVIKVRGYKWPGVVVAVFKTLAGEERVVVECTVPEVAGALHIYSMDQIERIKIGYFVRPWDRTALALREFLEKRRSHE